MTKEFLYDFIYKNKVAVVATVSADKNSESALVGIAVTPDLKIVFDTSSKSRKYSNIMSNSLISFVIGWENEQTIQYEGITKIPKKAELNRLKEIYFKNFPDGKE
ncbi:putative pyridoxamine 5'-phosphate oxidase family protein [Pedobacter sp. UYP30]|uniref:pyridoxamine 5'-phosphate oxidase family protein n=1 Tax=Pedobacter sp. UYP30 TaxID=1756400 RepID=UPI003393DEF1